VTVPESCKIRAVSLHSRHLLWVGLSTSPNFHGCPFKQLFHVTGRVTDVSGFLFSCSRSVVLLSEHPEINLTCLSPIMDFQY
jgi:hypothetical protein